MQVAGRAGRAEQPGEVLIQSRYPDHPLLQTLLDEGYAGFAASALAERQAAHWPPFARLALLRASDTSPEGARPLPGAGARSCSQPPAGVKLLGAGAGGDDAARRPPPCAAAGGVGATAALLQRFLADLGAAAGGAAGAALAALGAGRRTRWKCSSR